MQVSYSSEGEKQDPEPSVPAGRGSSAIGNLGWMRHGYLGSRHLSSGQWVSRYEYSKWCFGVSGLHDPIIGKRLGQEKAGTGSREIWDIRESG